MFIPLVLTVAGLVCLLRPDAARYAAAWFPPPRPVFIRVVGLVLLGIAASLLFEQRAT